MTDKEFNSAQDLQEWLENMRSVPRSIAIKVAPLLLKARYIYPETLLGVSKEDLQKSTQISIPNQNLLENKLRLQSQNQYGKFAVVVLIQFSS